MKRVFVLALTGWASLGWAGDAQHGAAVVERQGYLEWLTVNAQGVGHEANATAPDLGVASGAPFTPAALASALWNHTPAMWREVSAKQVTRPALAETDWADVFAYLYSEQIFQFPAQVRRGEEVFRSKECAVCHSAATGQPGLPVPLWKDVNDPAVLVYQMWNHAATMNTTMRATFDAHKKNGPKTDWPKMDGRDFGDLVAYVQSVQRLSPNRQLSLPEAASGNAAFGHYCEQCAAIAWGANRDVRSEMPHRMHREMWNQGTAWPTLSPDDAADVAAFMNYVSRK
jgi:hypothetical protein